MGLATLLSTQTVYAGLLWGLLTIVLTIILGRFFCGWVCPFGAIHQFVGFLANRNKSTAKKIKDNQYRSLQSIKYQILIFLLTISALEVTHQIILRPSTDPPVFGMVVLGLLIFMVYIVVRQTKLNPKKTGVRMLIWVGVWLLLSFLFSGRETSLASLQIGLLDPIPLVYRSINLLILPLVDQTSLSLSTAPRGNPGRHSNTASTPPCGSSAVHRMRRL